MIKKQFSIYFSNLTTLAIKFGTKLNLVSKNLFTTTRTICLF